MSIVNSRYPKSYSSPKKMFGVFIEAFYDTCNRYDNESVLTKDRYVGSYSLGEIFVPHKTTYGIGLWNESEGACNAVIYVDGGIIGKFRVKKRSEILIKRPRLYNHSLVFVSKDSDIAEVSGMIVNEELGVIKVLLSPEDLNIIDTTFCVSREPRSLNPLPHWSENNVIDSKRMFRDVPSSIKKSSSCGSKAIPETVDCTNTDNTTLTPDGVSSVGGTVSGKITSQDYLPAPYLHTYGIHYFEIKMKIGNPGRNTRFMGSVSNGDMFYDDFVYVPSSIN